MGPEAELMNRVVAEVLAKLEQNSARKKGIPVGVSNRHIHLSEDDLARLFGEGYSLTPVKGLQPGQYAAEETVVLVGPKGAIPQVRILGPPRKRTQVEISRSDGFILGVHPPVRESGKVEGTPPIYVVGPRGGFTLQNGLIVALRHIHMHPDDAAYFNVRDGQRVKVRAGGDRALVFEQVLVRVAPSYRLEMHIDIDEANAAGLTNGDEVQLVTC